MADVVHDAAGIHTGSNDIVTANRISTDASKAVESFNTLSTTSQARLLPELWAMTINSMRDRKSQAELAYLWTTVRRVSKLFEQEIEKLFREVHLGKKWIHADCGYRCVECRTFNSFGISCEKTAKGFGASHAYSVFVDSPFGFRNLEIGDKNMAIFKYRRESPPDDEDSDHSVIHGLLLALGEKGKPKLLRHRRHRYRDQNSAFHNEKAPIFVIQVRGGSD